MSFLATTISCTILSVFVVPLVLYGQTGEIFYINLVGGLIAMAAAVEGVKPLIGSEGIFGRPVGANACDVFCIGGPAGGQAGFPSGHMTCATMLISALWWHTQSPIVLWIGVPWTCAMAWSRWTKQCHNWQQILAGMCTGMLCGAVIYIV